MFCGCVHHVDRERNRAKRNERENGVGAHPFHVSRKPFASYHLPSPFLSFSIFLYSASHPPSVPWATNSSSFSLFCSLYTFLFSFAPTSPPCILPFSIILPLLLLIRSFWFALVAFFVEDRTNVLLFLSSRTKNKYISGNFAFTCIALKSMLMKTQSRSVNRDISCCISSIYQHVMATTSFIFTKIFILRFVFVFTPALRLLWLFFLRITIWAFASKL